MFRILPVLALTLALPAQESLGSLLERARTARDEGRYEEAQKAYEGMLAQVPVHETALLERAQTLAWSGRYQEALAGYRHFKELYPQRGLEADLRIAQVQAWGNQIPVALETLEPWVKAQHAQAVLDDATYRAWGGHIKASLQRLDLWLALHPEDHRARILRARFRSWGNLLKQARADYEQVLAQDTGNAAAICGLARLSLWAGDTKSARRYIYRISREDQNQAEVQILIAQCEAEEGRASRARQRLLPLATKGAAQRDAGALLDSLADAEGCWVELRHDRTDTNEGLRTEAPRLKARIPLADGHIDLGVARQRTLFQGDTPYFLESDLGLSYPLGPLWRAAVGLQSFSDIGGSPATGHSASLGFHPGAGLDLHLDYARSLFTCTPSAIATRGSIRTLNLGAAWTSSDGLNHLDASLGRGELSAGSHRTSYLATFERRFPWSEGNLRAGALTRGFGYSETLALGFFNPERYRYAGFTAGSSYHPVASLAFDLDGRCGWQTVNGGDRQKAWGYAASCTWTPDGSWTAFNVSWSESVAGLPIVEETDPAHYREHSLGFGIRIKAPRRWAIP